METEDYVSEFADYNFDDSDTEGVESANMYAEQDVSGAMVAGGIAMMVLVLVFGAPSVTGFQPAKRLRGSKPYQPLTPVPVAF